MEAQYLCFPDGGGGRGGRYRNLRFATVEAYSHVASYEWRWLPIPNVGKIYTMCYASQNRGGIIPTVPYLTQ